MSYPISLISDNSLTTPIDAIEAARPLLAAAARKVLCERRERWTADDLDDSIGAAAVAAWEQLPGLMDRPPDAIRAALWVIAVEAIRTFADEGGLIRVPRSSAKRGRRAPRLQPWDERTERDVEAAGGTPITPPNRYKNESVYWDAVYALVDAAEAMAAIVHPTLPGLVEAILERHSVADAARLAGVRDGVARDRLRWLGNAVIERMPKTFSAFVDAAQRRSRGK